MSEPKPKKVKITLQYPHEHGGELHPAGAQIDVWDFQAEQIRANEAEMKKAEADTKATNGGAE